MSALFTSDGALQSTIETSPETSHSLVFDLLQRKHFKHRGLVTQRESERPKDIPGA